MPRLIISSLIVTGLTIPIASHAEIFNALCDEINTPNNKNSSTIQVNNCQINLSKEGFKGPIAFIPKRNISQWYSVRQDDNLLIGVAGTAGGTYAGAFAGIAACGASGGVLCIPALLGGIYGGGRLGSQAGKGKNFFFTVIGENSKGNTVVQSFRFINRKTSKKFKKELSEITGLKMGQVNLVKSE